MIRRLIIMDLEIKGALFDIVAGAALAGVIAGALWRF